MIRVSRWSDSWRKFRTSARVHLRDVGRDAVLVARDEGLSAETVAESVSALEVGDVLGQEG